MKQSNHKYQFFFINPKTGEVIGLYGEGNSINTCGLFKEVRRVGHGVYSVDIPYMGTDGTERTFTQYVKAVKIY